MGRRLVSVVVGLSLCLCSLSLYARNLIKIGSSMGITGPYSSVVERIVQGIRLAFDEANGAGGVNGARIVWINYDDGYNAADAVSNIAKLVSRDGVDLLFATFGTPTSIATVERLDYYDTVLFFPITGFSQIYTGVLSRKVFTLLPSYAQEARQLVELAKKDGARSIGVVYYVNLYGFDVFNAARRRAKELGMRFYKYPFIPGQTDPARVVKQISKDRPDAVLFAIPRKGTQAVVAGLIKKGVFPNIYGEFYARIPQVFDALPQKYASKFKKVYTGMFLPRLEDDYPVISRYKAAAAKYGDGKVTAAGLQGYILGRALVLVLTKAGEWATPGDLIRRVETIKDLDIGLPERISYGPRDHVGMTRIFIYRWSSGRLTPVK